MAKCVWLMCIMCTAEYNKRQHILFAIIGDHLIILYPFGTSYLYIRTWSIKSSKRKSSKYIARKKKRNKSCHHLKKYLVSFLSSRLKCIFYKKNKKKKKIIKNVCTIINTFGFDTFGGTRNKQKSYTSFFGF